MEPHPEPPNSLSDKLLIRELSCDWFRSFKSSSGNSGAAYFGTSKFRFNSPDNSFKVLYAALSLNGMFIESFGRNHRRWITQKFLESKSVAIVHSSELALADITGKGLSQIGADSRLHSGSYEICQRWAAWIYRHQKVDGILYRSRFDADCECAAIFERAKAKLSVKSIDRLVTRVGKLMVLPPIRYYKFKIRKSPKR